MPRPSVPDDWKPPPRRSDLVPGSELVPSQELAPGARVDFAFGQARVRSFEVKGPFAVLLALVVLAAVAVVFALMFVCAAGVGVALGAGAAAAAALGIGVAGVRRLTGGNRRKLGQGDER
jgi:hypothetical protein